MKNFSIFLIIFLLLFSFSAHGEIAFVANVKGNWDLFYMDDEGGNLIQLTVTPFDEKDPAWSADRTKIVYVTSDGHLNILDIASGESRRIAVGKRKEPKFSPSFSPDDKEVAFVQNRPPDEGDDTDLLIFNQVSKTIRKVIEQKAIQMWPIWSQDGQRIVYANLHCAGDCGRVIQELWIVDRRGGWARQLLMTHSLCQQPAWSQDGKKSPFHLT